MSLETVSTSITQLSRLKNPAQLQKYSTPAIVTSARGILRFLRVTHKMITVVTFLLSVLFVQDLSLDSASPKERQAAVEQLAVAGNTSAIPTLTAALKKEPKSDIRAVIVAGFARIGGKAVVPVLAETLQTDLDKDVRL